MSTVVNSMLLSSSLTLFFCIFPALAYSESSCVDHSQSAMYRLRDDILCTYDVNVRPVADHTKNTTVKFQLIVRQFSFDLFTDTLILDSWLYVKWDDEHLKWEPDKYDNIRKILVPSEDIWTPDLALISRSSEESSPELISDCKCTVIYTGSVNCICPSHLSTSCNADLRKFPFGYQSCSLVFGSWYHAGEEVYITPVGNTLSSALDTSEMRENEEWLFISSSTIRVPGIFENLNSTYPEVLITFDIRHHSDSHTSTILIPFVVAILLTFASLCISAESKERLMLCYVNVMIQFLHLQNISYQIPMKSKYVPYLISFSRDSLLLGVMTIVFSLWFKKLLEKREPPPMWVSNIVTHVLQSRVGTLFSVSSPKGHSTLEEDKEEIIENTNQTPNKDWTIFARFLDRLLFIIYIVIYFFMTVAWL